MQTNRRNEVRPTAVSYAPEATERTTLYPPDGNPEASWITQGITPVVEGGAAGPTRHGFPLSVIGPEWFDNDASTWDLALNAHSLECQIEADAAGRGLTDPQLAGYDLAARIWSVKTWRMVGSFFGHEIDQSFASGASFNYQSSSDPPESETTTGTIIGRQFLPTRLGYTHSEVSESDDSRLDLSFYLVWPDAPYVDVESGAYWDGPTYLAAGLYGGVPVVCPTIRGFFSWNSVDGDGEAVAGGQLFIEPARFRTGTGPLWEVETSPFTLCGYPLRCNMSPTKTGTITGSLNVTASEFWGPDEWPA